MKLLVVSDEPESLLYDHFRRERWEGIDAIISCGDLPAEYLSFLVSMLNVPCYYVRGNHDESYEQHPPEGCENIDGRVVTFRGVRILGLEGARWYNGDGVQHHESAMAWKIRWAMFRHRLRGGGPIDIVVAHAPPFGVYSEDQNAHRGFDAFADFIEKHRPRYFLHGHTRLPYTRARREKLGATEVINCHGYIVLEVEPRAPARASSAAAGA